MYIPNTKAIQGSFWILNLAFILLVLSCSNNDTKSGNWKDSDQKVLRELTTRYEKGDTSALTELKGKIQNCASKEACYDLAYNLYLMVYSYSNAEHYNLAIDLYKAGRYAAENSGNNELWVAYYIELANNYFYLANTDSLDHYLCLAEQFPLDYLSNTSKTVYFLTKAFNADLQNKSVEAIEYYLKAYAQVQGKQSLEEAVMVENLGLLYDKLKYYNRSLTYLKTSLPIYLKAGDTSRLIRLYSNMGVVYMHSDSLVQAANFLNKSIGLAKKNSFAHARGLANYGNVLRLLGNFEQARSVIDSSTLICEHLGIPFGIFANKINMSYVLLDKENAVEAIRILKEVETSPFLSDPYIQIDVFENLMKAYEQLNDLNQAFAYQKKVLELKNTLESNGEERLALEWEERFLRQKKELELESLNHALIRSKLQQKLSILSGLFIMFTLLFIVRLFYLRKKDQQLRSKLLEEEGKRLRLELNLKERAITTQTMHLQSINGFAENITTKLIQLRNKLKGESSVEMTRIIKDFENGFPEEVWDDFRIRFERVHEDFCQKILNIAPDLTPVELKIASFLRLNLSSKEISKLTNRSAGTIINTRSSLRKKLNLGEDDNLVAFLMHL